MFFVGYSPAQSTQNKIYSDSILDYYSRKPFTKDFFVAIAKLKTGNDIATGLQILDSLITNPSGDMFWTYQVTAVYFYCKNELPDSYRTRILSAIRKYKMLRGDTDNHFLLYYTSIYLCSQEDTNDTNWFNGKTSL